MPDTQLMLSTVVFSYSPAPKSGGAADASRLAALTRALCQLAQRAPLICHMGGRLCDALASDIARDFPGAVRVHHASPVQQGLCGPATAIAVIPDDDSAAPADVIFLRLLQSEGSTPASSLRTPKPSSMPVSCWPQTSVSTPLHATLTQLSARYAGARPPPVDNDDTWLSLNDAAAEAPPAALNAIIRVSLQAIPLNVLLSHSATLSSTPATFPHTLAALILPAAAERHGLRPGEWVWCWAAADETTGTNGSKSRNVPPRIGGVLVQIQLQPPAQAARTSYESSTPCAASASAGYPTLTNDDAVALSPRAAAGLLTVPGPRRLTLPSHICLSRAVPSPLNDALLPAQPPDLVHTVTLTRVWHAAFVPGVRCDQRIRRELVAGTIIRHSEVLFIAPDDPDARSGRPELLAGGVSARHANVIQSIPFCISHLANAAGDVLPYGQLTAQTKIIISAGAIHRRTPPRLPLSPLQFSHNSNIVSCARQAAKYFLQRIGKPSSLRLEADSMAAADTVLHTAAALMGVSLIVVDAAMLVSSGMARLSARLADCAERAARAAPALVAITRTSLLFPPTAASPTPAAAALAELAARLWTTLEGALSQISPLPEDGGLPSASLALVEIVKGGGDTSSGTTVATPWASEIAARVPLVLRLPKSTKALPLPLPLSTSESAPELASLLLDDMAHVAAEARRACAERLRKEEASFLAGPSATLGVCPTWHDLHHVVAQSQAQQRGRRGLGVVTVEKLAWEDVGGMEEAKRVVLETVELPLLRPDLIPMGLRRTGLLLYGPPGTGKTLLARAVASQCRASFLSIKGPELVNMYVGQSEANVREVFSRARTSAPCIIFFDELDALAPARGRASDSGGVMDRVVAQLLTEMDGVNASRDIFVIGATNRPDLLDDALLRPGRLDKLVYVGVPSTEDERRKVFRAVTRRCCMSDAFEETKILTAIPMRSTNADIAALATRAAMHAVRDLISAFEGGKNNSFETPTADDIVLETRHFERALDGFHPSLTAAQLLSYEKLRQSFSS